MLTPAWTNLKYHSVQARLWRSRARFCAVYAGRGSGKTELARRRIVRMLPIRKPWPNPMYFYALPTFAQAKRVAWGPITSLIPKHWIRKINDSELRVDTVFGSQLYVVGMDKPQRVEGTQWDGGIVDESCDQKPGVFDRTLMPAFAHRKAWCWRIGVPKRTGSGAMEFKAFCERGSSGQDPEIETYTWPSWDIVPPEEINVARSLLDEKDFNEQYGASWETVGGLIFHAFNDVLNVSNDYTYQQDLPLLIGCDFNVDPMAWVIGQVIKEKLIIHDELFLRNTNTREALNYLYKKYGAHRGGFRFYGDATSRARKTSASESDYVQIRNDARFINARVNFPSSNPPKHDRFAACNAQFCSANDERRCLINPKCRNLIHDLTHRAYKPGQSEPDDEGDIGHITDALGYLIYMVRPLRVKLSDHKPEVVAV